MGAGKEIVTHSERLEDGGEDKHHSSPVEQVASARLRRQRRQWTDWRVVVGGSEGRECFWRWTSPPALVQESRSPSSAGGGQCQSLVLPKEARAGGS